MPEKRKNTGSDGPGISTGLATMLIGNPFVMGNPNPQSKLTGQPPVQTLGDSRFSQYKLNPQATLPGMISVGALKNIRSDMIQAEVMKHESVLTGRIAPEEQKKYKNLRFPGVT